MRGPGGPRYFTPLLPSSSASLHIHLTAASLLRVGVSGSLSNQHSSLTPPLNNFRAASASPLQTLARPVSSAHCSADETPAAASTAAPIRTTQDLHTALLSLAHAAASPSEAMCMKSPSQHLSKEGDIALHGKMDHEGDSADTKDLPANPHVQSTEAKPLQSYFPTTLPAAGTERQLLQRLLLHRRHNGNSRRSSSRGQRDDAANSAKTRQSLRPFFSACADIHKDSNAVTNVNFRSSDATWSRAFELFSEAVQQRHVSPTAQHFNLLLYIAHQYRLWGRMDAVEEFQAHLLASVQQLVAEKNEERRKREEGSTRAEMETVTEVSTKPTTSLTGTSLRASPSTSPSLSTQIAELREMEAALMPNAQTYELLITAALARGSWSRALEYCEMRMHSGIAVMTDKSVCEVLQVYALASKATSTAAAAAATTPSISSSTQSPHSTPLHRLRTDQQGSGLRAAAQTRAPTDTNISSISSTPFSLRKAESHDFPSSATTPPPYWSVALAFFRSSLNRVSSMQTVQFMVAFLAHAGRSKEILQVLTEDCRELMQSSLFSLATHVMRNSQERVALLQTLQMMSNAACEVGDWQIAQQLLRDVVELRRQLSYAQTTVAGKLWGAPSLSLDSAESADASPLLLANNSIDKSCCRDMSGDGAAVLQTEQELSRHVLQNTLHTLRRVRRYPEIVDLYRTSPSHSYNKESRGSGDLDPVAGELTLVWQTMWTPEAISFVAQAGLATGDLDLLLELCGFTDASTSRAFELIDQSTTALSTVPDVPADVFDATLRLLQSRILQHCVRQRTATARAQITVDEPRTPSISPLGMTRAENTVRHYVALSQRVYAAYRHRALEAIKEETSPYRQYLNRLNKRGTSNEARRPTPPQHELQQESKTLRCSASILSKAHAPLVQLLAQSIPTEPTEAVRTTSSFLQHVLTQFKSIRRPDTLAIALAMDVVHSQACLDDAPTSPLSQRPAHRLTDAAAQSLVLAVQQIYDTVLEGECLGSVHLNSASTQPPLTYPLFDVSLQQLTSLSTVTSAAVLLSCDILARAQPLVLLRFIPLITHLGWLPRELAAQQLQRTQQAVAQWTAAHQPNPTHLPLIPPLRDPVTKKNNSKFLPYSIDESGGAAVAHFVQLYAQSTMEPASPTQQVLAAAAQVMTELQRAAVGHPPTAAMAAFKRTLHEAWRQPVAAELPALRAVVVASINTLVQQVSASTVSRWTMWRDCADLVSSYFKSPLATYRVVADGEESSESALSGQVQKAEPTSETLRVLHMFVRLCDKAEAPFVEYVTMRWILSGEDMPSTTGTLAVAATHTTASQPRSPIRRSEQVPNLVKKMCALCLQTPTQQLDETSPSHPTASRSGHWTSAPLTDLQTETMLLLLDALSWACRRHVRPLARQLYATLTPWIDALLSCTVAPSTYHTASCVHQLERLRDAAQSSYMTLSQCFSNGARSDVLRDWPVVLHVLQQLASSAAPSASLAHLHRVSVLVDGITAVVVKLQRTFHFLLVELALNTHRSRTRKHAEDAAESVSSRHRHTPISLQHQSAVEAAADEFATWCTFNLIPNLLHPSLRMCTEGDLSTLTDASSSQMAPIFTSLLSSHDRIAEAVWEVDYVSFVWQARFRAFNEKRTYHGGAADVPLHVWTSFRSRGYQLLISQLRWSGAEVSLTRPLRLWLLFSAHFITATAQASLTARARAIRGLCHDLTTLEVLYTLRSPCVSSATTTPPAEHRATPPSFLHYFIEQVDELTTAMITRALPPSPSFTAASVCVFEAHPAASAALPRMPDGSSAMDLLTKPSLHFTPQVLRLLQQAAQQLLYLSLCEGTIDVQPICSTTSDRGVIHVKESIYSSLLLKPILLRRCLAWPGLPDAYPALLQAIEVVAYETLREPAAVVDVFNHMSQLHSAESELAAVCEGSKTGADEDVTVRVSSSAEMFLTFYLNSAELRRVSPASAEVCLAALLACAAASAATASEGIVDAASGSFSQPAARLPRELLTLLCAFPQILADDLFKQWQQRTITMRQEKVLRSWLLVLLWGGTKATKTASSVQPYSTQSPVPFPLPLRRAALQWLVLTQSTILPPPLLSTVLSHEMGETAQNNDAAALPARYLVDLLNSASESFAAFFSGSFAAPTAFEECSGRLLATLSILPLHGGIDESSKNTRKKDAEAVAAAVQAVVSQCATRHAVQQLLQHYQTVDGTRAPLQPCEAEMKALVEALPPHARKCAEKKFMNDPNTLLDGVSGKQPSCLPSMSEAQRLEDWALNLNRWIDAQTVFTNSDATSLAASPLPPPPKVFPTKSNASLTWNDMDVAISAATRELLQLSAASPLAPPCPENTYDFRTYARPRFVSLRPLIEGYIRKGAALSMSDQATAANEASACVNALLVFSCVYVPLASSACTSPQQVIALLRHELLRFLCVMHLASPTTESSSPSSPSAASFTLYAWFVQQHLRPLLSLFAPLQLSTTGRPLQQRPVHIKNGASWRATTTAPSVTPSARALDLEAFAVSGLILHHLSSAAFMCVNELRDPVVCNSICEAARDLFQQSAQNMCNLLSALYALQGTAIQLLRRSIRTWMQAGVLLGESHTILRVAQRLAVHLIQRQQKDDVISWTHTAPNSKESICKSDASLDETTKVIVEWLDTVPVAIVVCAAARNPTADTLTEERLTGILSILPRLRRSDASVFTSETYLSLLRCWQEQMRLLMSQASGLEEKREMKKPIIARNSTSSPSPRLQQLHAYLTHLIHAQPFSVVFQATLLIPSPAKNTDLTCNDRSNNNGSMLEERLHNRVADYLAGPPSAYPRLSLTSRSHPSSTQPPQEPAIAPLALPMNVSAGTPLTPETLRAAMRCVMGATAADMKAFVQLESMKAAASAKKTNAKKTERGQAVRHAWHLMERAAFDHRQHLRCHNATSTDAVTVDATSLVPLSEWTTVFLCRSVAALPHTVHFVRPAVSEVLMLESCRNWAEGLAILQHSLRTLQRTGATVVQQYMAQLLLQRVRTVSGLSSFTKTDRSGVLLSHDFISGLDTLTHTVSEASSFLFTTEENGDRRRSRQLWFHQLNGHTTHGAAALACRLIEVLLASYEGHSVAPSLSSTLRNSVLVAQHTLIEALRCSVHDVVTTRALFLLFWSQLYPRVEGAHAFLSALRAAKTARDEAFAVQAILTYLWVTTPGPAEQRAEQWETCFSFAMTERKNGASRLDFLASVKEVQGITEDSHQLSVEAHRAVWKSWTTLCRMGVVTEAVALCVVDVFKALGRLSEVEELMVTTCYTSRKCQVTPLRE